MILRNVACDSMSKKDMCVAVSLDIRNVFNTISWDHVFDALRGWRVQPYLVSCLGRTLATEVRMLSAPRLRAAA